MDTATIIVRFVITAFLSLLYGFERQYSHKPIGFGTFIYVSIGSCALALTAIILPVDNPLPLLSGIVTGIGFLGAGALIKTTDKIFGFTTAAGIWIFAVFGLLIGIGEYLIGLALYLLIWIVVFIDRLLERKGIGSYQKKLSLTTTRIISAKEVGATIAMHKHHLIDVLVNKKEKTLSLTYLVEGTKEEMNKLPERLMHQEWFEKMKIE